jgi:hypothetical protein
VLRQGAVAAAQEEAAALGGVRGRLGQLAAAVAGLQAQASRGVALLGSIACGR